MMQPSQFLYKPLFICLGEIRSHPLERCECQRPAAPPCTRRLCQTRGARAFAVGSGWFQKEPLAFDDVFRGLRFSSADTPTLMGFLSSAPFVRFRKISHCLIKKARRRSSCCLLTCRPFRFRFWHRHADLIGPSV